MLTIKKWLSKLFNQQNIKESNILTEDKDLIILSVLLDCQTNAVIASIDVKPYSIDDNKMIKQAEALGSMLNRICSNNLELTELIINSIEHLKKQSTNHLLFYTNVLFFWKHLLANSPKNTTDNSPVIRPTQVFNNR